MRRRRFLRNLGRTKNREWGRLCPHQTFHSFRRNLKFKNKNRLDCYDDLIGKKIKTKKSQKRKTEKQRGHHNENYYWEYCQKCVFAPLENYYCVFAPFIFELIQKRSLFCGLSTEKTSQRGLDSLLVYDVCFVLIFTCVLEFKLKRMFSRSNTKR